MAKYVKWVDGGQVFQVADLAGVDSEMFPVIVLPEADWRELVSVWRRVSADATMGGTDDPCDVIDDIIQRTEEANNG